MDGWFYIYSSIWTPSVPIGKDQIYQMGQTQHISSPLYLSVEKQSSKDHVLRILNKQWTKFSWDATVIVFKRIKTLPDFSCIKITMPPAWGGLHSGRPCSICEVWLNSWGMSVCHKQPCSVCLSVCFSLKYGRT